MNKYLLTLSLLWIFTISPSHASSQDSLTTPLIKHSIGVGYGIPYGIWGVSLDLGVLSYLDLTFGFGTTYHAGVAYSTGMRYYLRAPNHVFRPRVSLYYGINSGVYFKDGLHDGKTYRGLTMGAGALWLWKSTKFGFDIDLNYILTTPYSESKWREKGFVPAGGDYGRIKIDFGIRRAF